MYRIVLSALFSFLVIIYTLPVHGDAKAPVFDIDELVNLAFKRSELLNASEKIVDAAKWSKDQAGSWQNPSISFGAGNKTVSGKTGLSYEASITQPCYFPGKQKLAVDIAAVQEKIALLGLSEARLYVRYSVIKLSYQYAVASELTEHLEERVGRFKAIRKNLSIQPFLSPKKRMEKHVVEMKLVLLQKSLDEIRSGKEIIWAKLNLFLDLQGPVDVKAPWFSKGESIQWEGLLAKVESGNIDLNKQLLVLERTRKETELARTFAFPDFSLSFLYEEDRVPEVERFFGAGITFTIPLWNTGKGNVKSLEAAIDAEKAKTALAKREAGQALVSSFLEYEIVRKNLERLPVAMLKDVHVRLADADDSFNKGLIDFITYGDVESQAYDMHSAILGAQYDYVDKYTALLILQGSETFILPTGAPKHTKE